MAERAASSFSLPEPSFSKDLGFLRGATAWTLPSPTFDKLLGNLRRASSFGLPIEPPPPTPALPAIGAWSPSVGSTIARDDAIDFEVTDADGNLARVVVVAEYPWGSEIVHDGSAFAIGYADGSTRTSIANGYAYSLLRDDGWSGPALTLAIYATDTTGAEATPTDYAFTVSDPVVPDIDAPVVGDWNPAPGVEVLPAQPIAFSVTDDSGAFRRILVHAVFADGVEEVVHDGDAFRSLYLRDSTRVLITGGLRYTVARHGGWPGALVTFRVFAIDRSGKEGT